MPYCLGMVLWPSATPVTITTAPFSIEKKNPILRGGVSSTGIDVRPVMLRSAAKPIPSPTSMLNIGPAKHAVMAMIDSPFLATVMLASMSWRELPHASTVRPMIVEGMWQTMPKYERSPTSWSAIRSSHVAETRNPHKVIGTDTEVRMGTSPEGAYRATSMPTEKGRRKTRMTVQSLVPRPLSAIPGGGTSSRSTSNCCRR
mmetsp:Transcript_55127/g.165145  ORF Transcript_55127/g.165145 Transcript_55127/m.165145 type:complete len:201 (-) Transcript_55127:3438-4040(-)